MAAVAKPRATAKPAFGRVLLKLSGEALMGPADFGLDPPTVDELARELVQIQASGVELALVIGGGSKGLGRACAMSLAKNGVELVINSRTVAAWIISCSRVWALRPVVSCSRIAFWIPAANSGDAA